MSRDEFDADIERLFARSAPMADASAFAAAVEHRLDSGSRIRTIALASAGLIGGVFAVRESLNLNLVLKTGEASGRALGQGIEAAGGSTGDLLFGLATDAGLSGLSFGSMGGMQMFWITASALVAVATLGILKLSREV